MLKFSEKVFVMSKIFSKFVVQVKQLRIHNIAKLGSECVIRTMMALGATGSQPLAPARKCLPPALAKREDWLVVDFGG